MEQKNPAEDYFTAKEAAKEDRKKKEIELWQTWKNNGMQPHHLEPLLNMYGGTIAQKVKLWKAPRVPDAAFKLKLQEHMVDAFKTYDPSRGAALNTWVEGRLQKAKRFNARHQNIAYIPEGQIEHITPINKAIDHLTEEFGREPSNAEIAEHINMQPGAKSPLTAKRVETIRQAQRKDIPGSAFESDPTPKGTNYEESQIAVAANILPHLFPNKPEMHTLFNHLFGTNGHDTISSTTALAKKMGKNQQQIARMKTTLGDTLRKHMGLDLEDED
jgi:hypothetical protein